MKDATIKVFKVVFVLTALVFIVSVFLGAFGTDEQRAEKESGAVSESTGKQAVKVNEPESENDSPLNKLVADNQPDPTIGGKTRMEVLVECQAAIKEQLSNPRSFDTKIREVIHKKYEDGGEHLVGFKFYAKNQFNAESEHMGVCAFDGDGKRLTAEYR